ncbi:Uncharacterised protein [Vibrio cholerae]|nr:Uncharacterised protein [Vibrio cholerae]
MSSRKVLKNREGWPIPAMAHKRVSLLTAQRSPVLRFTASVGCRRIAISLAFATPPLVIMKSTSSSRLTGSRRGPKGINSWLPKRRTPSTTAISISRCSA